MGSPSKAGREAREGIYYKMAEKLRVGMHINSTKVTQGMTIPNKIFSPFCGIMKGTHLAPSKEEPSSQCDVTTMNYMFCGPHAVIFPPI